MANLSCWWTVKQYLLENDGLASDELLRVDDVFHEPMSPLSSEITKIAMTGEFSPLQYFENISRNLIDQHLNLKMSTWRTIDEIFSAVERDRSGLSRKVSEILLIMSKLSADQFHHYYRKLYKETYKVTFPCCEIAIRRLRRRVVSRNALFDDRVLRRVLLQLTSILHKKADAKISLVDGNTTAVIKTFLRRPAVVAALTASLKRVDVNKTNAWISEAIDIMMIYYSPDLIGLNGITVSDGFVIVTTTSILQALSSNDYEHARNSARVLTTSAHECCHFLARYANGDFNFCSPGKLPELRKFEDGTNFELGRNTELLLFGGVQPKWELSSLRAAQDFVQNATVFQNYPLIEEKFWQRFICCVKPYLARRAIPSLSFAADLDDLDDDLEEQIVC